MQLPDIYFYEKYGKLYENIEKGIVDIFNFKNDVGKIYYLFIKREIPLDIDGGPWFDITTPYGYGGPIIIECEEGYEDELVLAFERSFSEYCKNNKIVSEFIRFHPIIDNAKVFSSIYSIEHIRNTLGTDLKSYDDPFQEEFSKSARRNNKKSVEK